MKRDIKKIIETDYKTSKVRLPENHRMQFEQKLKKELHGNKNKSFLLLKIAASILFIVGIGFAINQYKTSPKEVPSYTLGSLSPELNRIEKYYTSAIAFELSKLEVTEENAIVLETFFTKIALLNQEYSNLSAQLNIDAINAKTINKLIDNLQLRLQLLLQLKEQLKILKDTKNETNKI